MKKNFAKKLATVLSLTMVASLVVPAVPASAATAPDLASRRTYVYEGNNYSYTVKNATGYTVKWSVSGEGAEYVDLSKTSGAKTVLTVDTDGAKAAKLAPVVVKAKFYKSGKLLKTRTDSVSIKVSATGVALNDIATVPVGETADFNRTLTPANSTSKTYFKVTAKDGTATTGATIDANGKFVATKAGEYKVVAEVKNAKDSKVLATATKDIKAELKLTGTKLTALNKVVLTFNDSAKDVIKTAADVKIETVATNKSIVPVKAVALSDDGKTVTVTTYSNFANDVTYKVTAVNSLEFKAQVGTINKIVIDSQSLAPTQLSDAKKISYTVVDEYGVDVTANYPISGLMSLTSSSTSGSYVAADGTIVIAKAGDVVSVQLKYLKWNTTTGADESITSNVATLTGVSSAAASTSKWMIDTTSANWDKSDYVVKTSVAAEDNTKFIFVKIKDNYGTETINSNVKFESLDPSVLLVDATTGQLFPLKVGSAVVKVVSGDFVDYLTITVTAKIESAKVVAETTNYKLSNSNTLAPTDSKSFKFTLKDNYDVTKDFDGVGTIKTLSVSDVNAVLVDGATLAVNTTSNVQFTDGVANVVFTAVPTKTGTGTYLLTADGKSTVVSVTVVAPAGSSTYKVELSDTEVDPFTSESTAISLFSVDANQVKVAKLTTVSGTAISYTVKDAAGNTKVSATTYDGTNVVTPASTWADGVYTVTVTVGPVSTTATFTVKSSKLAATAVVDDNTVVGTDLEAALQAALTTKVDGTAHDVAITSASIINLKSAVAIAADGTIAYTASETSVPVYVKTVTFTYNSVVYTADVNAIITISLQ